MVEESRKDLFESQNQRQGGQKRPAYGVERGVDRRWRIADDGWWCVDGGWRIGGIVGGRPYCVVALKEVVRLCVQRSHREQGVDADGFCARDVASCRGDGGSVYNERKRWRRDGRR